MQNDDLPQYHVKLKIQSEALEWLKWILDLGEEIRSNDNVDRNGWETIKIVFGGLYQARTRLLGFGSAAQGLEPEALRLSIIDYTKQVMRTYQEQEA